MIAALLVLLASALWALYATLRKLLCEIERDVQAFKAWVESL